MSCGSIYKIQFPNGKHYIGLTTTSIEKRKIEHKQCAKIGNTRYLYNALRKYDMIDNFELIEIDTADTLEELYNKEKEYIIEYNSFYTDGNGYNMTHGGDGVNGYIFTEEDKRKNSERRKQYYKNNPNAGKEHSERLKKLFENPEAIQKNIEAQKKYQEEHPEARQKMSEIKKKHYTDNPEAKQILSEIHKKRFENPEERHKNSERQKKRFENPEERHKNSERRKKWLEEDPEARRKISRGEHKPFDVFTIDGTFIETFTYQFEAKEYLQKEYNIASTCKIGEVLSGKRNNSAGFVFKYE
jgi:group I intron endonuclease